MRQSTGNMDVATKPFALSAMRTDPQLAATVITKIGDEKTRSEVLSQCASLVGLDSPKTAAEWLIASDHYNGAEQRLLNVISRWSVASPSEANAFVESMSEPAEFKAKLLEELIGTQKK